MTAFSDAQQIDEKTALHTAARRFCEGRFSEWCESYRQLEARDGVRIEDKFKPGWEYSEGACEIFPRYRLDKAIRVEVERLTPKSFKNLEEMRSQLINACNVAEARLQAEFKNATAVTALRQESEDYRAYVTTLRGDDLYSVTPLPFRRVL